MRGATFVRLLVLALVATALPVVATAVPVDIGGPAAAMAATESSQQPNFVVVVTDDQRWDSIGRCSPSFDGSDYTSGASSCMPQVAQKLVANGVTFLRGEVSQSLCCPSRASILTGQYTRHHGVATLNGAAFDDSSSLATWLDSAGYRTGLVGKYLNGYGAGTLANYIPPGWDSFHAFHGYTDQDNPYTDYPWIDWDAGGPMVVTRHNNVDSTSSSACADGNLYSTDLICNQSMDFLASDSGTPFFLYVNPASPHSPQTIATRHQGIYAGLTISTYPSHNVIPSPNPPAYLRPTPLTTNQMNRYATSFRQALEQNRAVDDMVGVLYDQLAGDGRLANTVWVFVSDNGAATGEHRLTGKQCPYIECHRVPFIVVCPTGVCPGAANGTRDAVNYALNIDIAPTIADLAGVTPTLRVDGRSLVPILSNPGAPWRTEWALFESNVAIDGVVAKAADGAWYKYLVVVGTGEKQLYHLGNDPWELTNLWNNPSYSAVQTTMEGRLADALSDPGLTITVRPLANGPGTSATISFTSGEAVGFRCALDGGPETDCGTGTAGTVTYSDLTPGEHHVDVTAVDAYGNAVGHEHGDLHPHRRRRWRGHHAAHRFGQQPRRRRNGLGHGDGVGHGHRRRGGGVGRGAGRRGHRHHRYLRPLHGQLDHHRQRRRAPHDHRGCGRHVGQQRDVGGGGRDGRQPGALRAVHGVDVHGEHRSTGHLHRRPHRHPPAHDPLR